MSKVIIFSEFYPKYHPKAGKGTLFPEKIIAGLSNKSEWLQWHIKEQLKDIPTSKVSMYYDNVIHDLTYYEENRKYHTIRRGNRWKVGDWFSPRVWSGKPYRSKQIQFAPDIQVKKVWKILVWWNNTICIWLEEQNTKEWTFINKSYEQHPSIPLIIRNDGLETKEDFFSWLTYGLTKTKPAFEGQIICWNDKIIY